MVSHCNTQIGVAGGGGGVILLKSSKKSLEKYSRRKRQYGNGKMDRDTYIPTSLENYPKLQYEGERGHALLPRFPLFVIATPGHIGAQGTKTEYVPNICIWSFRRRRAVQCAILPPRRHQKATSFPARKERDQKKEMDSPPMFEITQKSPAI